MIASHPERHVVLIAPEVHWNTGNIGRTCLGAGAALHLIRPLGFSLEDRQVKRAGLDYWDNVNLHVWDDLSRWEAATRPKPGEIAVFSKIGVHPFWRMARPERLFLLFGSETRGLPEPVFQRFRQHSYHIPIQPHIRCLNLSTTVGIALYESLRPYGMDRSTG